MNFQQLRSIREAARRNFNLTEVANVLFTSQPGVSRQIREVEEELGVDIFERHGKRLTGLTDPGKGILQIIERLLIEAENLRQAGDEYSDQSKGTLTIATTHTQARYVLPKVVQQFRLAFPGVRIALQQSAPEHIAEWVLSGKADIGIATEGLSQFKDLVSFPCYEWSHMVVVPLDHPLAKYGQTVQTVHAVQSGEPVQAEGITGTEINNEPAKLPLLTLEELAEYPLITYDLGFTGRGHIDAAFRQAKLGTDIVLTAMDSDVIQQYVALGLGVGIVASMALEHHRMQGLVKIDASHLFSVNVTRLAVRKGAYLRSFSYEFIERFAPDLSRAEINQAVCVEN